ncbi:MAG TPA: putative Fe-S cluster assembly protein SufT [Candidatus Eisenbacteria bacterium]|nr:putative Fe-S cluster assembly protein SufT [Candidatus Eisenbacteria bacterium]
MHQEIIVNREVDAILIPAGNRVLIPEGVTVVLTQSLGGSYTVLTPHGQLARISGKDADALGLSPAAEQASAKSVGDGDGSEDSVREAVMSELKQIYDPEIPVNIVDLWLVYTCDLKPAEGGGYTVEIRMTMTAPGCGMGDVLKVEAEDRARTVPGVKDAHVEIVWEPAWDQTRMSEAARLELGFG